MKTRRSLPFILAVLLVLGCFAAPGNAGGAGANPAGTVKTPGKGNIVWSPGRMNDPAANAREHWEKHGKQFPGIRNLDEYVAATHAFTKNPPAGALIKTRPNGDRLYYHPDTNTFAVTNAKGLPRTMFKPANGMRYWGRL